MNTRSRLSAPTAPTEVTGDSHAREKTVDFMPIDQNLDDRKASEDRLRAMATRLSLALQAGQIGVWEWDFQTNNLLWDARMYEMFGIAAGTPITSELWKDAVHPEDRERAGGIFAPSSQQGLRGKHRFRIVHATKGVRFIESAEELVLDSDGHPIACVGMDQDVTEWCQTQEALRSRQSELEKLSVTDPLTGVGNRRKLDESLRREVSRIWRFGGKLCLLIADVDHFKAINDEFGHGAGDAVLKWVAETMQWTVRDTDGVARLGGDEFCIVMPGTAQSDASIVADRIQWRLQHSAAAPALKPVTASMGLVEMRDGETAESLLHRADQALYQAKAEGRNRVVSRFDAARRAAAARSLVPQTPPPLTNNAIYCMHCFRTLGSGDNPRQSAALRQAHRCPQALLAALPAAPPPFN